MPINDRRAIRYSNKRIKFDAGSYLDPCQGGPWLHEDFIAPLGATLADSSRVSIAQSGTPTTVAAISATAGAPVAGHGGWLAGSVDNVDNEIDEIALGDAGWLVPSALPTGGLIVAEVGHVLVATTARMIFFGFGDAVTGGADDDGMISIVSGTTLVSGATGDAAGFIHSSLATDADNYYTGNVLATAVGTAYNTSAGTQGPAMDASTADDYTRLRVEIDSSGNAFFYAGISTTLARGAVQLEQRSSVASAVTATVPFLPIYQVASTTTTAVDWEIDYLFGAATHG